MKTEQRVAAKQDGVSNKKRSEERSLSQKVLLKSRS